MYLLLCHTLSFYYYYYYYYYPKARNLRFRIVKNHIALSKKIYHILYCQMSSKVGTSKKSFFLKLWVLFETTHLKKVRTQKKFGSSVHQRAEIWVFEVQIASY